MKRLTFLIEDEVHHRLKLAALNKGMTMTQIVSPLIKKSLKIKDSKNEKTSK